MKSITSQELQKLIDAGEVLEQDGYGVKVVRLTQDRYLKIFNRRPGLSMAKLLPRSKQFARNAKDLKKRGITTVGILDTFKVTDAEKDCVCYHGIPGDTLRNVLRSRSKDRELSQKLGAYIAQLHDAGVMFRSLHFGNIIQLADGSFGLIDIADLRVNVFPLNRWQRQRNFQHVFRYKEDYQSIDHELFVDSYVQGSRKRGAALKQLVMAAMDKSKAKQIT